MADVIQVTAASEGTYLIAEVVMGGMSPPQLHTARNGAEMARKVRDLFEGPAEGVPLMIRDAFDRDSVVAKNSILALLQGMASQPVDEDDPGVGDPLDPGWLGIF